MTSGVKYRKNPVKFFRFYEMEIAVQGTAKRSRSGGW